MKVVSLYTVISWAPVPRGRRLAWQMNILRKEIKCALGAAGDNAEKRGEVEESYRIDVYLLEEEIESWYADQKKLAKRAARLHVPLPDYDEVGCWARGQFTGEGYLTDEGCRRVRELIRAERRGQWEFFSRWVPVIGAIAALIAALSASGVYSLHCIRRVGPEGAE